MPSADSSYTKSIVAKPDGTFGWENKVDFIPLTGTGSGAPVTGEITIINTTAYTQLFPGNIVCSDSATTAVNITNTSLQFFETSLEAVTISQNGISSKNANFIVDCYESGSRGLTGAHDYSKNIQDLDYVQKKYVDQKTSYSAAEVKTGGTWIDGKPIYKKTVFFDNIPSNGEIELITHFPDLKVIVSNQMFTEWLARDIAFAGNHWKGQTFFTLQKDLVRIEDISYSTDYSQIDSFTLTLEYTKTTD